MSNKILDYTGYIYLWFDTKSKLFYLGGHKGKVEDSYICSNEMMKRAYVKRSHTFKFKVLEYTYGDNTDLRICEQKWLDMIKDEELYWTNNIYNKTVRYYNKKKLSLGGSVKGHKKNRTKPAYNKGMKRDTPAWNKGMKGTILSTKADKWLITTPDNLDIIVTNSTNFCHQNPHITWSTLYLCSYKKGSTVIKRGKYKGWSLKRI